MIEDDPDEPPPRTDQEVEDDARTNLFALEDNIREVALRGSVLELLTLRGHLREAAAFLLLACDRTTLTDGVQCRFCSAGRWVPAKIGVGPRRECRGFVLRRRCDGERRR